MSFTRCGFEFEFYSKHSYYKTLELLNNYLAPIKVYGFKQYHSKFKPDSMNFKIEPDHSGGSNMMELVTGPLSYTDCRLVMLKILKFIQEEGYTNDKSSIHINLSFDTNKTNKTLDKLNVLRTILNIDEDKIYKAFPNRHNNIYAKSIKKIIPYKQFDFVNNAIQIAQNSFYLPEEKYYGVNFGNIYKTGASRLEYRYIGGEDYQYRVNEILDLLEYFVTFTYRNINEPLDNADLKLLKNYFQDNIGKYKNFSTYDKFLTEYGKINLQVNTNNQYDVINTYFNRFSDKLFDLMTGLEKLGEMVVNYNTESNRLEVLGTDIDTILDIYNCDFIDCNIYNSMLIDCQIVNSEVKNAHLTNCQIFNSDIIGSKLTESDVNSTSLLQDCYFFSGLLNGEMQSGIFRSGKLGESAYLHPDVKIIKLGETIFDNKNSKKNTKEK